MPSHFSWLFFVYSWSGTAIIVICPFGGNNDVDEGVEKGGSAQCCILVLFSPDNFVKFIQFP